MKSLFAVMAALLFVACLAFGQATTTSTTAAAAITATDSEIYVASATGIAAPRAQVSVGTVLAVEQEQMAVRSVSSTKVTVKRGYNNTRPAAHASASTVWIGAYNYFGSVDPVPGGSCTATDQVALPLVVPKTGNVWQCVNSAWVGVSKTPGTAAAGVTVTEYGDHNRVTKLSFSGITVGAAVAQANLAFGKLLYTLPAGAIVIHSARLSASLMASGATCDADTPALGVGTVISAGAFADLTNTATWSDLIAGQVMSDVNGTAVDVTAALNTALVMQPGSAHTIHLNAADGWAGACTVTATGSVTIEWTLL